MKFWHGVAQVLGQQLFFQLFVSGLCLIKYILKFICDRAFY